MAHDAARPDVDPWLDDALGADDPWCAVNASRVAARAAVAEQNC
jgi:hypothetical protein